MLLKEIPVYERPREKALKYGLDSLSNNELIAIILRTGTKDENVLSLTNKLFKEVDRISDLKNLSISELTKIKGIGKTKAITLLSAIELGFRIINDELEDIKLTSAENVYEYLLPKVKGLKEEHLFALYLDAKGNLISCKLLTKGNINSTIIDGKLIFKWGYKLSATAIILSHNHPSLDPTPSIQDLKYTETIIKQAGIAGFIILDHIIIGNGYYSMKKESKLFKMF